MRSLLVCLATAAVVTSGCREDPERPATTELRPGLWRGILRSPGGPLPFGLNIPSDGSGPEVINGQERVRFDRLRRAGDRVIFEIDVYDAVLDAQIDGERLVGEWRKRARSGVSRLPFHATPGYPYRFAPDAANALASPANIAGVWTLSFTDDDGTFPGQAELRQDGRGVRGTILTPTGDYRYLVGDYANRRLRLSTFDGAHAFLFVATADEQGTLTGDFWSRDTYRARFVGRPKTTSDALPDPFQEVALVADDGRFRFEFPDLDGKTVSWSDSRFKGRVLVVEIFGTWCPNCNDLAPLLTDWYRRFKDRGLEIVGLAFEYTDDPAEAAERLRAYSRRHGVEFPLLRAGVSDKASASAALPDLERIKSYPTTVFIGRDGKVSRIHSGFAGPATGGHYRRTVADMENELQRLLGPAGGPMGGSR